MKKFFALFLAALMLLSVASAAEKWGTDEEWRANLSDAGKGLYVENLTQEEFDALTETTIIKDPDSITGYTVTFRHYAPDANRVRIRGEWSFYQKNARNYFITGPYDPEEWKPGMFALQVNVSDWPAYDMVKNEATGVWSYTIPLPSGTWSYRFIENGVEGAALTDYTDAFNTSDVNNRPFEKDIGEQGNSQVRVPFDAEKQTVDHSLQLPRLDGKVGLTEVWTFETEVVPAENLKDDPAIAVYLPYGYDANRAEPYKVVYISHGAGTESETSYYNKGSMVNITDNLIAEGLVEPMVIVIINNFSTGFSEDSFMADIVPLVEANYNVRKDAEGKCVCGLSAGSSFTRRVMAKYPAEFGTYGVFSGGGAIENPEELAHAKIYLGNAYYDSAFSGYETMVASLEANGMEYGSFVIASGHIWDLWRQIHVDFLTNFLWK